MKVGVLTFANTLNYGAELQAFALCNAIAQQGHTVELVNYQNAAITHFETPHKPSLKHWIRHPVSSVGELYNFPNLVERASRFDEFAQNRVSLGKRIFSQADISDNYDAVVVGSDQVWNFAITGGDLTYFLNEIPSGNIRKVSYAASFGSSAFSSEISAICGEALRDFRSISVRESSGVEIVKNISGCYALQVVDPTLLLERSEWLSICAPEVERKRFVFAYLVSERKNTLRFAREAAETLGASLVVIDCYGTPGFESRDRYRNNASPEEFLALIRDASLVVTSSFHGLALSLALNTDVCYALDTKKANANSRLENLAVLAGVENREISNGLSYESIDFTVVEERLRNVRKRSLTYLKDALAE